MFLAAKEANSPDRIVTQTGNNGLENEELPFWVKEWPFFVILRNESNDYDPN